jgi:cytochrome c-type biogenesis protein CcmH/NrfG
MKKQSTLLSVFGIFALGFVAGVLFSAWKLGAVTSPASGPPDAAERQSEQNPNVETMQRIASLEKRLMAKPDSAEVLAQLGNDYFDLGNHQKAISYYSKALEIDPNNSDVLTDMAISYRKIGNPQESVNCFRKALAINPNHQLALFNMGIVLRDDLKDESGALEAWEKFLALGSDSPHAVMVKPWVKQLKDKQSKAEPPKQ